MPSPLDSWPKLSWGTGTPALQGLPWLAPCPGQRQSVCLGCEDEESVFLFADPLHELVDSTDGAGLGPQGTVAYVELKGAGYLREKTGYLLGTCLCLTWGWLCIFPSQEWGAGTGAPVQGHGVAAGYPIWVAPHLLRSGRTKPHGLHPQWVFSMARGSSQQHMAEPAVTELTGPNCCPCPSLPGTEVHSDRLTPKGPHMGWGNHRDHGADGVLCHHPLTPPCRTGEAGLTHTLHTALTHARRFSLGPVK